MEWWKDRIFNGIAKAAGGLLTKCEVERILTHDVAIYVDPCRAVENDLWPGIWALAATLSRQFTGKIYLSTGLDKALLAPSSLSPRCIFTESPPSCRLAIGLGRPPAPSLGIALWGDARGNRLAFGQNLAGETASPISAFALAGYLSFALLASAAGFPPHKERFCQATLEMDPINLSSLDLGNDELAILGLGHLGNAYLGLLYFIAQQNGNCPGLLLLDRGKDGGKLEKANWKTHVLLDENPSWEGSLKTDVFSTLCNALRLPVIADTQTLQWGWKKPNYHPHIALMGFDSFETRRIAIAGGYEWLVDAGIGLRFDSPRITWHSLPPDKELGKRLFDEGITAGSSEIPTDSPLARSLDDPRNPCGWVRSFQGISAAAPAMGIVTAAYAMAEVLKIWTGERRPLKGSAYLWSSGIPYTTEWL